MRSRLKRFCIALAFLAVFVVLGVTHQVRVQEPDFFSSPVLSRDTRGYAKGSLDVVEPASKQRERGTLASAPMSIPEVIAGKSGDFVFDYGKEPPVVNEKLPKRWTEKLLGDDKLELVAMATWYPAPDDDFKDPNWKISPIFRDPQSLEVLDDTQLDELGVPFAFRSFTAPIEYYTPKMRLLFRTEGMAFPHLVKVTGGSDITGAQVTFDLDSLGEETPNSESIGDWTYFDLALLTWHDCPTSLLVEVLTGEPQTASLTQERGAEVVFGDRLKLQWLGAVDGNLDVNTYFHNFTPADSSLAMKKRLEKLEADEKGLWMEAEQFDGWKPSLVLRASNWDQLAEHCAWRNEAGKLHFDWQSEGSQLGIQIASIPKPKDLSKPIDLVFIPRIAELSFSIAGFPDTPNPEMPENLFDIVLPRVTLDEEVSSSEQPLIGYIGASAQVAWEIQRRWGNHPPKSLPDDRTFRNMTATELLHWYLRETPGATVRYDEAEQILYFNEKQESWTDRLSQWWDNNRPDWTYF